MITSIPVCCGQPMASAVHYGFQCMTCGSKCSPRPSICTHSTLYKGYCRACGANVIYPTCCGRTMVKLSSGRHLCSYCGAVNAPEPNYREFELTRESEGWTTTLAKLIGPCSPTPQPPPVCKYEYAHAPDATCLECDWVGPIYDAYKFR